MAKEFDPYWLRVYLTPRFYIKKDGPPTVVIPVDEETAKSVIEKMNNDISPENLYMDGEASAAEVDEKLGLIMRAKADLEIILKRKVVLED